MANEFSDEHYRRLMKILEDEGLEEFLPYAKQAAAEAKLRAARRLVWKSSRQIFIVFAGTALMVATFWEKSTQSLGSFLRWLIGQ